MIEIPPRLRGTEIVNRLFGYWPSFHDAEILSVHLDRVGSSIAFELLMPNVPLGSVQVAMRFDDVENLEITDFNYQNVIMRLTFSEVSEKRFTSGIEEKRLRVELEPIFGIACSFTAACGEVVAVTNTPSRPAVVTFQSLAGQ